jgi:hypothetical protein
MMRILIAACLVLSSAAALAAEPTLQVDVGGEKRSFTRDAVLAMPEATTIAVANDTTYHGPMTYRAVPVATLLAGLKFPPDSVLEAVAVDGFVAQLPLDLVLNTDPSKPSPGSPSSPKTNLGPISPGRMSPQGRSTWVDGGRRSTRSAASNGPTRPRSSRASRHPPRAGRSLRLIRACPATDPVGAGQALFGVQCLPCHKLNGIGAADVGPDLNRPMNPTEYTRPKGLHA